MRFVSFARDSEVGLAFVAGGRLLGRTVSDSRFPGTLDSLVKQGEAALLDAAATLKTGEELSPAQIEYLPPLQKPGKIICVGLNYREHSAESGFKQPDYPTLFARFASSLIGHGAEIVSPYFSDTLDFEGELVAVIGKSGRSIPREHAHAHVMGYSLFNDASVREYQFKSPQWTVGKNFDGTGAFGPELVTSDELPLGGHGLKIETRLNGETVQSANTADLVFDVATLISTISEAITLSAGDIIVTGTPSGVGHSRTPRLYMQPGDVCEVEIEGVGLLRNRIVRPAPLNLVEKARARVG